MDKAGKLGGGGEFAKQVENWGTPRVTTNGGTPCPDSTGNGSRLEDQAGEWGTPNSHERTHAPRDVDHGKQLANQADQWQTPATDSFRPVRGGIE